MAIYHLAVKSVSRSTRRSAVAAAAYRSGGRLENERDGLVHDYRGRGGVEAAFIVTPEGRGMFNEMVRESRRAREYIERGREWLRSVGERMRSGSELAARGMTGLVQGAARVARAELDRGGGAGMVPAIGVDASGPERTSPKAQERQVQLERERIQVQRDRERDGPDRSGRGR